MKKYFDAGDLRAVMQGFWRDERALFEREFAAYLGVKHALATSFGRTALYTGLRAIGVKDGEVLIAAFTCTVVRHAIVLAGATPRFVDVEFDSFDMSLVDLRQKLSGRTRAIIVTHYFGRVAGNLEEIARFAKQHDLVLIEDCAHSLGAEFRGKKIGTYGDLAAFSLTKNTVNFGGGFLVTDNEDLYRKAHAIVSSDRYACKARSRDMPLVLAYGLEQMIFKLSFDRICTGKKKWLLALPRLFVRLWASLNALFRMPARILSCVTKGAGREHNSVSLRDASYDQSIQMDGIIAALGRRQLRKVDAMIGRRKHIYEQLKLAERDHFGGKSDPRSSPVCTHLVLRISNDDIVQFAAGAWKRGLSLVATWPTRQTKWRHLESDTMVRIAKEILVYSINPDLTDRELDKLSRIVGILAARADEGRLHQQLVQER